MVSGFFGPIDVIPLAVSAPVYGLALWIYLTKDYELSIAEQNIQHLFMRDRKVHMHAALHECAKDAIGKLNANIAAQHKSVYEKSEPTRHQKLVRQRTEQAADAAKKEFWQLHDYLRDDLHFDLPDWKIAAFAECDPRVTPWPTKADKSESSSVSVTEATV